MIACIIIFHVSFLDGWDVVAIMAQEGESFISLFSEPRDLPVFIKTVRASFFLFIVGLIHAYEYTRKSSFADRVEC
jgi:hypothetical protein